MLELAVDFYKNLFGEEEKMDIYLGENFWGEEEKVLDEENISLDRVISEEEVREAVLSSYAEGAPGPDGFTFLFYQKFWEVIKTDLINMFRDLIRMKHIYLDLTFAMLTLIPKEADTTSLKKYRPISLTNCSFIFFCKSLY
jgi:hypothetical protein